MKRNTALSAAAALTMAGGVSALTLTMQQESTQPALTIVTEYVDQFGNAVAAPMALSALAPAPVAQPTGIVVGESNTSLNEHPEDDDDQEGGTNDD